MSSRLEGIGVVGLIVIFVGVACYLVYDSNQSQSSSSTTKEALPDPERLPRLPAYQSNEPDSFNHELVRGIEDVNKGQVVREASTQWMIVTSASNCASYRSFLTKIQPNDTFVSCVSSDSKRTIYILVR